MANPIASQDPRMPACEHWVRGKSCHNCIIIVIIIIAIIILIRSHRCSRPVFPSYQYSSHTVSACLGKRWRTRMRAKTQECYRVKIGSRVDHVTIRSRGLAVLNITILHLPRSTSATNGRSMIANMVRTVHICIGGQEVHDIVLDDGVRQATYMNQASLSPRRPMMMLLRRRRANVP